MFFPDIEMNEDLVIDKTRNYVKEVLSKDSSGHDYWHAHRVSNLAREIGEKERASANITSEFTSRNRAETQCDRWANRI